MAEPSRPPPPKAYVPSKKPGLPPSRPSAGPSGGGQTGKTGVRACDVISFFFPDLPIPPRPPPEDIPPVSPTDPTTAKSRSGRGSAPPPPPAPYSKRPSAAKVRNGVHVFLDTCLLAFVRIKKTLHAKFIIVEILVSYS